MAKLKAKEGQRLPQSSERVYFYTELAYMPSAFKERRMWIAQSLWMAKQNSQVLVDPQLAYDRRMLDRSIINEQVYREILDPRTPAGNGGTADMVSADFKANPIDVHIDNILEARIEKAPVNLTCKVVDPVAKLLEQQDMEKIIFQKKVRQIINSFIAELGGEMQPIRDNEDPYKWIEKFTNTDIDKVIDTVGGNVDQIRNKIEDDDQLRLFRKFVYKNGIEIAFEQAIQYYLIDQNKWDVNGLAFLKDIKNFNTFSGMMYTDLTTGRKVLKYLDPCTVYVSPFNKMNGDDIVYWYTEQAVTFAEFEQMVGAELTYEDKKDIFNYYRTYGTNKGLTWDQALDQPNSNNLIGNSKIMLGTYHVLTQEAEEFSEKYMNADQWEQPNDNDVSWADTPQNRTREVNNKVYNVWYSCYYLPIYQAPGTLQGTNTQADYNWQANHVYRIKKNVDMYRYGVDQRYAKSDLVIWQDRTRPSYSEIKQRYMPKIHTCWHKFQNCIVQDTSAQVMDYDLLAGMLSAVDEGNSGAQKVNKQAIANQIRTLKQTGTSYMKFRDKNGQKLDVSPQEMFVYYDNKMLDKAEKYLLRIMELYEMMTRALSFPPAMEGVQPKARTPLGGVQIAVDGGSNNQWYIEKAFNQCLIACAERIVQHVKCICSDKTDFHYEERWKELVDVVGFASGATLEGISKIPMANIGLSVEARDTTEVKEFVNQIAANMMTRSEISPAQLELILDTPNWKMALFELAMEQDKNRKELEKQAALQHQRQMELGQQQFQIAMALQGNKAQGVNSNIQTDAQMQAMLDQQIGQIKAQADLLKDERRADMKASQDLLKGEIKKDQDSHKANLEAQAAV